MQTTNETVSTKLDMNIDYAQIEVRAAREALAAAKNKPMLVALAVSIGVLKSKSSNAAKTIRVEPLRDAIEDALRTAEQRAETLKGIAPLLPVAAAITEEIVSRPENAGRHAAPAVYDLTSRAQRRQQVRLTSEQRARKLSRNRRRHKRALTRSRHGWANGQQTIRGAA
jgi:nucleotidyltransferase/DNA polymerase involved in DNA repair